MQSVTLARALKAKKDALCSIKYPEYQEANHYQFVYKPASCSKKASSQNRPRKMDVRDEIRKALEELGREGHLPTTTGADIQRTYTQLRDDANASNLQNYMVESYKMSITHKCALDCLSQFLKDPLPPRQKAEQLVVEWRRNAEMPNDPNIRYNISLYVGVILTYAWNILTA